jgi:hypothetical protein
LKIAGVTEPRISNDVFTHQLSKLYRAKQSGKTIQAIKAFESVLKSRNAKFDRFKPKTK